MSVSLFYLLVIGVSMAIFVYLLSQKFWLSQAVIHIVMGAGLYILEIQKMAEADMCQLSVDSAWLSSLQLFVVCTEALNLTSALSLVLLFSGLLTVLFVPLFRHYETG